MTQTRRALLAVLGLSLTGCQEEPPVCPGLPAEIPSDWRSVPEGVDREAWDAEIRQRMRRGCIPGLSVSVVTPAGEELAASWGYVDVTEESSLTVDTPFMIASVSKAVDALALYKARDEGLLEFDSNVSDLVDFEVKNRRLGSGPEMQIKHLATHSSGIQDNWNVLDESYQDGDPEEPLGEFLEAYFTPRGSHFSRRKNFYTWPAGREWFYSNVGAALAAYAVEVQAGEPYQDYSRSRLFDPLSLEYTGWFLADFADTSLIARPHQIDDDGWVVLEHYGFPTWPDGQLRTTASELGQLMRLAMNDGTLDGERILEPGVRKVVSTEPVESLSDWYIKGYIEKQFFFWFGMSLGDRWLVGHDGDDDGVSCEMFFEPKTDVGVVLITNISDGALDGAVREETWAIQEKLYAWGETR